MIQKKIVDRDDLIPVIKNRRAQKKTIGFTSGTFDLLHAGHADYLERAKSMCDLLVVGINSDISVKKYKGENRPFVSEKQRLKLVAALESVDYVFLFDERRNQKNIEILKPDFYVKSGDYQPEELTSKEIVEKYGGEVRIIPVTEDISTTGLLEKISNSSEKTREKWVEKENAVHLNIKSSKQRPAIFLDRDGTINVDVGYLHKPEKFEFLPNALEGIKKLADMGYRIVIVSNQPGIGIGYFSEEDFYKVNRAMLSGFSKAGILIDKIYFCPHSESENCECRKPNQLLIERARDELNLDLSTCYFIGDKTSDLETGRRAGIRTILVETGFGGKDGNYSGSPDFQARDLLDAAEFILKFERE